MRKKISVLTITSLFPNSKDAMHGIFVKERMSRVAKLCNVKVIAPIPWFPLVRQTKVPFREKIENLEVYHPKFFSFPGIFKSLDGLFFYLSTSNLAKKLNQKYDFDLIDTHFAYPDGVGSVFLAKMLKKPVALTIRGSDITALPKSLFRRIQIRWALKNSDQVISVCGALKDEAKNQGASADFVIIPNGVDSKKFKPIDKFFARKKLNLPWDKKIVVAVGENFKCKGFFELVKSFEVMAKTNNNLILVIVGFDKKSFKKLNRLVEELNLSSSVLLTGRKAHNEVLLYLNACDVYCLPSYREGWPNSVMEALSCGKPVVATSVFGIPDIIKSPVYGILIDKPGDIDKLASALKTALNKEWNSKKIRAYAKTMTWEKTAKQVYEVFQEIAKR